MQFSKRYFYFYEDFVLQGKQAKTCVFVGDNLAISMTDSPKKKLNIHLHWNMRPGIVVVKRKERTIMKDL